LSRESGREKEGVRAHCCISKPPHHHLHNERHFTMFLPTYHKDVHHTAGISGLGFPEEPVLISGSCENPLGCSSVYSLLAGFDKISVVHGLNSSETLGVKKTQRQER
jgi:hypothetical protein